MYPFSQTLDVSTEDEEQEGQPVLSHYPNGSCSNHHEPLARRQTNSNLRPAINGNVKNHFAPRLVGCISRSLRPVFIFLRILSLFPVLIHRGTNRRRKRWRRLTTTVILFNVAILLIALNGYLTRLNFQLIVAYEVNFGLMHASTVSAIISGIKPFIACFLIALFTFRIKTHTRLIRLIDAVDLSFRSAFRASPPVRKYTLWFFTSSAVLFLIPFIYRIIEYIQTGLVLGDDPLNDFAFILVPMLTVWNIVPLMYYSLHNKIVRFYLTTLIKALDNEHKRRVFSLKFYYEQFLRITVIQEGIGTFFNPYILFSLSWSVAILCLTIYFMTQDHASLSQPITAEQFLDSVMRKTLNTRVHFAIGWAAIQVVVAALHIVIICHTGMLTNERTRQVVNSVLRIVPDQNADLDRFQIACFVHKMTTQFMWGMTVWRAFPLERSTFFTLFSLIVTYSFLLLKLKDNPNVAPIMTNIVTIVNSSSTVTAIDTRP
ncbi:egl-47 [Pristionchus pacificus]|uniref:Egl-47 n=1 Tax=Pristionchus pacificus TaxID=54126 RepID=A0A2A6CA87_PRIPA|nr:egl-47 [Pristionchus pacificus]|eukprot:PDM75135.1 egl-47 [Pristionchus pacificus]